MKIVKLFIISALAFITLQANKVIVIPDKISLKSVAKQKYIRAGYTQQTLLAAQSNHVRGWEKFKVIKLGNNKIALKSLQNNKYIRAGVGSKARLAAVSNHIKGWETFQVIYLSDGNIALKSIQNNKYVTVGRKNKAILFAKSTTIGSYEKFAIQDLETNNAPRTGNVRLHVTEATDVSSRGEDWRFSFSNVPPSKSYWIYTAEGDPVLNHKRKCPIRNTERVGNNLTCVVRAPGAGEPYWVTEVGSNDEAFRGTLR
jgi:hypothetical protein